MEDDAGVLLTAKFVPIIWRRFLSPKSDSLSLYQFIETPVVVYESLCTFQTSMHSLVENSFPGFAGELTIFLFVTSASKPKNVVLKRWIFIEKNIINFFIVVEKEI